MVFKNLYLSYSMISNQEAGTSKRTVSIKRHGLNFFKKSLLNVLYDLKNQGLNTLPHSVLIRNTSEIFGFFKKRLVTFSKLRNPTGLNWMNYVPTLSTPSQQKIVKQ